MTEINEDKESSKVGNRRVHMANERTFLAWIRTSIGIFLVGLGTSLVLFAFIKYKKVERQIDSDTYKPSSILDIILTISMLAVGIFLITYLIQSI